MKIPRLTAIATVLLALPISCSNSPGTITPGPTTPHTLDVELIKSGFASPIFVTAPRHDSTRIFVVERGGKIKIIKLLDKSVSTFLDISGKVLAGGERGLLGLAFHPLYHTNSKFYVYYSAFGGGAGGHSVVAQYTVSGNPEVADGASEVIILTQDQPESNHNGGMIAFGPNDGFLYIGLGDGGGSGDAHGLTGNSQNKKTLLGKMLRIDVDGGTPYAIPGDNPFFTDTSTLSEIWATGLRNPWRWSFDRSTGDMYIGDVGQGVWEEINFEPAFSPGGFNWGWRLKEGTHCFNPTNNCDPDSITTDPFHEYFHVSGRCSITGGYVYRGSAIPGLQGTYFFADYCTGEVWSLRYDGDTITEFTALFDLGMVTSFGEDAAGELYICDFTGGEVLKIIAIDPASQ